MMKLFSGRHSRVCDNFQMYKFPLRLSVNIRPSSPSPTTAAAASAVTNFLSHFRDDVP